MKMLTREENERLTRVGPGTPAGTMLRHYWWPIAFADEVRGKKPRKVRLLGEDFVLFRDGAGRVGMLEPHCAHRRTSLANGRVEERGIRCCYHGWLWSAEGRCLEIPSEAPEHPLKDRVSMASYPTEEAGGLVFAYIGRQPAPLLPRYDLLVHASGTRYVWGFTDHCNWLQSVEQAADPHHLAWLHAGPYPIYGGKRLAASFQRQHYGLDYKVTVAGVPSENAGSVIFPAHNRFTSGRVESGVRHNMLFRTPEDDTKSLNFFITYYPGEDGVLIQKTEAPPDKSHRGPWIPTEPGVYPPGDEEWWGVESMMQDRMALENQGEIADRSIENLAPSDRGVLMFREMLKTALEAVAAGRDPMGVVRDPARHELIEFGTYLHTFAPALRKLAQAEVR
jgi:5,5'-dehydrodivanillate O-demethylase